MYDKNEKIFKVILLSVVIFLALIACFFLVDYFMKTNFKNNLSKEMQEQKYYNILQIVADSNKGQETYEYHLILNKENKVIETRIITHNCTAQEMNYDRTDTVIRYNFKELDSTTLVYSTTMNNGKSKEEVINFYENNSDLRIIEIKSI